MLFIEGSPKNCPQSSVHLVMPLLWNLPLESCSVAWKGEDRVVLWSYCVYLVLKYYVPFKPVSLPWTVKCSLPSFCMVAHFTPSLVLSLVLLSCPLPSLGHCALLRGESKSRTLTDLLFLRSHWKQNQQQEKKKITCLYDNPCQCAVVGLFQSSRDRVVWK